MIITIFAELGNRKKLEFQMKKRQLTLRFCNPACSEHPYKGDQQVTTSSPLKTTPGIRRPTTWTNERLEVKHSATFHENSERVTRQ